MSAEHQSIARPGKAAETAGAAPAHVATLAEVGRMPRVPSVVSPDLVMMLQRTAGNAAVSRLLAARPRSPRISAPPARESRATILSAPVGDGRSTPEGAGTRPPAVQRKLMPFAKFAQATGQMVETKSGPFGGTKTKKDDVMVDTIRGTRGVTALKEERHARGLGYQLERSVADQVNINEAYKAYEADPSLKTLIALYDTITFWEAINAGRSWVQGIEFVLQNVKTEIEAEVRAETKKLAGNQDDMLDSMIQGKNKVTVLTNPMPKFLMEVGVPAPFYKEHLEGHPDLIGALEAFYNNLRDGHQYNAEHAFKKVNHLEGMHLIRPLFIGHFPQQAHLQGLVGTDAKKREGQDLTLEEVEAIKTYSGGQYQAMNTQMRNHAMRPETKPFVGGARMQPGDSAVKQAEHTRLVMMKDATAGLSKLPKFQGIAYRMMVKVPDGYFGIMQKGATVSDLGFQSASPSMTGVGNFAKTQMDEGAKNLYFIIHTRTAASIVGLSESPGEGEVLFRPGTRFQVQAVWEHVDGKVPPSAPPQAQMILHTMGEYKSKYGLSPEAWEQGHQEKLAFAEKNQGDKNGAERLASARAESFFAKGAGKVRVLEMIEV